MIDFEFRSNLATIVDVLRIFDPRLDAAELDDDIGEYLGPETLEKVQSELEAAESALESETNTVFRLATYGQAGERGTYHWISKDELINDESNSRPTRFYLRPNLIPFDPDEGDELAYRTGTDSFTTIPESQYMVNWRTGEVELFDVFGTSALSKRVNRPYQASPIVARYRYGAGGHRTRDPGQTELTATVDDTDGATVEVENTDRLPPNTTEPVLLGHSEYARIDVDRSAGTITLTSRGLRGTDAQEHGEGAVVHYCPMDIRDAVAGKAAASLNDWDFAVERISGRVDYGDIQTRIERAEEMYNTVVTRYRERDR